MAPARDCNPWREEGTIPTVRAVDWCLQSGPSTLGRTGRAGGMAIEDFRGCPTGNARKKRPPERPCPRGAEDSRRFRERLDALGPPSDGRRVARY